MRSGRIWMVAAVCVLAGGCAVSKINIPSEPTDKKPSNPNAWTVLTIETNALEHLVSEYPPNSRYIVGLPSGTTDRSYNWVIGQLPLGGTRYGEAGRDLPAYRVAQVSVRQSRAQVDVILPAEDGGRRLISVMLRGTLKEWAVERTREWAEPVEEALKKARPMEIDYVAPKE